MKTWRPAVGHMDADGFPYLIEEFFAMVLDFTNKASIMIISGW
jgi:hypothetical protein